MFKLGPPKQIAYAVPDAFEAAKRWVKDFGAGPFCIRTYTCNGCNLSWISIYV